MLVLTIRTDKPESEIGLYKDGQKIAYETWQAHRALAETIHQKIKELLDRNQLELSGIQAILVFKGPGSFTGLRIGMSVANALSYSLNIPVATAHGGDWLKTGLDQLANGQDEVVALPDYGAPAHITAPKK